MRAVQTIKIYLLMAIAVPAFSASQFLQDAYTVPYKRFYDNVAGLNPEQKMEMRIVFNYETFENCYDPMADAKAEVHMTADSGDYGVGSSVHEKSFFVRFANVPRGLVSLDCLKTARKLNAVYTSTWQSIGEVTFLEVMAPQGARIEVRTE